MQCLPARFAIEAPACHDRPPYLDSTVKRPAKQATKKDAHRSSIPGRSAPRALGQLGRHSKKGSLYLGNSGQIFVSSRQRGSLVAMPARWAQGAVSAHNSQRTRLGRVPIGSLANQDCNLSTQLRPTTVVPEHLKLGTTRQSRPWQRSSRLIPSAAAILRQTTSRPRAT
jgi:hypothetical protein